MLSYRRGTAEWAPMARVDLAPLQPKMDAIYKERNQNRAFARAILEGRKAPVPGEAGMRDIAICQAVYRSSETGKRVNVDDLLRE